MAGIRTVVLLSTFLGCTGPSPGTDSGLGGGTGGDDTAGPCDNGTPSLAIGEGEEFFEALDEGDPVMMVHGVQDGWHITGAVRAWHTESVVRLAYTIEVPSYDDAVIVDQNYRFKMVDEAEGCARFHPALTGFISLFEITGDEGESTGESSVKPYEILAYETLRMRMVLTDESGVALEETLEVTAVPDPQDVTAEP